MVTYSINGKRWTTSKRLSALDIVKQVGQPTQLQLSECGATIYLGPRGQLYEDERDEPEDPPAVVLAQAKAALRHAEKICAIVDAAQRTSDV